MMTMDDQDDCYSSFFDDLIDFDDCWDHVVGATSFDTNCASFSSCEDSVAFESYASSPMDSPFKPRSKKAYSKKEVKKQVREVSVEEASYFVDTVLKALNAADPVALASLMARLCVPDVLVSTQCYDGSMKADSVNCGAPMTPYNIVGVEQFARYWSMVTQYIPDGIFMNKIAARPCSTDGDVSVYVGGIAFQGTSLVKEGSDLFTSTMIAMTTQPYWGQRSGFAMSMTNVSLSGSLIVYVNARGLIYRMDLFLEY